MKRKFYSTNVRWLQSVLSLSVFATLFITFSASAQETISKISGTVLNEKGQPVEAVSVAVKNGKAATVTDASGHFSINASPNAVLLISSTGFVAQEVNVRSQTDLSITVKEDAKVLDEVTIGYQRLRKSDVTGAVSSVKARELNLTTPTLGQALVGKVAGVQVSQTSGAPYSGPKIRVRGIGSVNASSEPLYVIDGYPIGGNPSSGQGNGGNATGGYNPNTSGNDIFINPEDIESIEILKDAASAAIYGSRASAGVVLITTKRGKQGAGKVEYDYQVGSNELEHKVQLLDANGFASVFVDGRNANYKDILISKGIAWNDAFYSDDNATRLTKSGQTATGCSVCILKSLYDFPTQKIIAPQYNTDWQDALYTERL